MYTHRLNFTGRDPLGSYVGTDVSINDPENINNYKHLFLNINQLDALNFFYNKFISSLYMFQAHVLVIRRAKIVLYSLWYHHTYRWSSRAQIERGRSQSVHGTATYRCDDTRDCVNTIFALLTMSTCARNM